MGENNQNINSSNESNNQKYYNYQTDPWTTGLANNNQKKSIWDNNQQASNQNQINYQSQGITNSNINNSGLGNTQNVTYPQTSSVPNQNQINYQSQGIINSNINNSGLGNTQNTTYSQTSSVPNQTQMNYQSQENTQLNSNSTYLKGNNSSLDKGSLTKPLVEYSNVMNSSKSKSKKKNNKLMIIIVLIVVLLVIGVVFLLTRGRNGSSTTNNEKTNNTQNIDNTEQTTNTQNIDNTEQTNSNNSNENNNNIKKDDSLAKINSNAFLSQIEKYATFSLKGISGYEVQVPVATSGDVTCTTKDGTMWTGIVANGSESCDNYLKAVSNKININVQEAKIIFDASGKVKNGTWIKINDMYCTYNGTTISECTTIKPE